MNARPRPTITLDGTAHLYGRALTDTGIVVRTWCGLTAPDQSSVPALVGCGDCLAAVDPCPPLHGDYYDDLAEERKATREGRYDSDWTLARLAERRAG